MHVGGSGHACAPPIGLQRGLQCPGEAGEVTVVDTTVVQLAGELAEQPRPVMAGGRQRASDLDAPLDDVQRG